MCVQMKCPTLLGQHPMFFDGIRLVTYEQGDRGESLCVVRLCADMLIAFLRVFLFGDTIFLCDLIV